MNRFATYEEENIHYWTHRAPGYSGVNQEELATDQKRVWGRTIQERIAARFPGRKPGSIRVLDVGTGPGFFAIILARMGYQVTAVDYTASMLEEARRNAGALADKIDFHQMNAEELMFADYSFDVLVTRNVTWNLHDPEKAYSHWTRVLAPSGTGRIWPSPTCGTRTPERTWTPWRPLPGRPPCPGSTVPSGICVS